MVEMVARLARTYEGVWIKYEMSADKMVDSLIKDEFLEVPVLCERKQKIMKVRNLDMMYVPLRYSAACRDKLWMMKGLKRRPHA